MPSKESLKRSWKFRGHHAGCACSDCWAQADLLDEAIRQETEKAIQIAASYGHEVTSPFCEEKVAVANCMLSAAHIIEDALRVRLAQLREGKT